MSEQEILDKLSAIFQKVFRDPNIKAQLEMTSRNVRRWDSLAHVDMILMVEKTFGIKIPTSQAMKLANVGELVTVISSKVKS